MSDSVSDDDGSSSDHSQPSYTMDEEFLFMPCPPMPRILGSSDEDDDLSEEDNLEQMNSQFDWRESTPGNGWTQRSLNEAFQQLSEGPGEVGSQSSSALSPVSISPRRRHTSLLVASIEAAACARCKCPPTMYCMGNFDLGVIFRLRHSRSKLCKTEEMAVRNADLAKAAQKNSNRCMMDVEGKEICLQRFGRKFATIGEICDKMSYFPEKVLEIFFLWGTTR